MKTIEWEDGFILMNLSKNKKWRALLHRVIAKQQSKRGRPILGVYRQWESAKRRRALIHRMITNKKKINR